MPNELSDDGDVAATHTTQAPQTARQVDHPAEAEIDHGYTTTAGGESSVPAEHGGRVGHGESGGVVREAQRPQQTDKGSGGGVECDDATVTSPHSATGAGVGSAQARHGFPTPLSDEFTGQAPCSVAPPSLHSTRRLSSSSNDHIQITSTNVGSNVRVSLERNGGAIAGESIGVTRDVNPVGSPQGVQQDTGVVFRLLIRAIHERNYHSKFGLDEGRNR